MTLAKQSNVWQNCITHLWSCRTECQKTFFNHCLDAGGPHLEKDHVRMLFDCMEICQTAADSLVRGSPVHAPLCAAAASICDACADTCEAIETQPMLQLAAVCRDTAKVCREMSLGGKKDEFSIDVPPPENVEDAFHNAGH